MSPSRCQSNRINKQGGWLMPVAAFIVVVMALFASTLGFLTANTGVATAQELVSTQAFFAAESGANAGMSQLFFNSAAPVSRSSASAACVAVNGQSIVLSVAGLNGCAATIRCQSQIDTSDTTTFFTIDSTASCGSGQVTAQRTVAVSAYLQ